MQSYAIIENTADRQTIVNAAVADAPLADNWELLPTGVAIGWSRSGPGAAWQAPVLTQEFPRFVGNEKLDLFTQQEQLAVVTETMTDPMVKLMYDRLLGAAYLSYEDPETEQGLAVLVDKGLLTPERKAEIVQQMQPR